MGISSVKLSNGLDQFITKKYNMSKVKIPENVANWINFCKAHGLRFFGSVEPIGDFGEPLADAFYWRS